MSTCVEGEATGLSTALRGHTCLFPSFQFRFFLQIGFSSKCQALTLFGLHFLDTILPVDNAARMINDEIIAMSSTLFGIENSF